MLAFAAFRASHRAAMSLRIGLIHAVTPAMAPVEAAFRALWPDAERMNVLDDRLAPDRERAGALTPPFFARIRALADYAVAQGADGILYTCSAFGLAIEAVARALPIPVLTPDEAMFTAAIMRGRRIGMLATFGLVIPAVFRFSGPVDQEISLEISYVLLTIYLASLAYTILTNRPTVGRNSVERALKEKGEEQPAGQPESPGWSRSKALTILAAVATAQAGDVSAALLQAGLVRRYGGGHRASWCD